MKTLLAAFLCLSFAQLVSAQDKPSLVPLAGSSEREMLLTLSARLARLEERIAALEASQQTQYAALKDGIQIALNQIGEEIGKLKTAAMATSAPAGPTHSGANQFPPAGKVAGPAIEQWQKVKSGALKKEVVRVLGEPKSVSPTEDGEIWKYDGGGWVEFYNYGVVKSTGGYGQGN